MTNKSRPKMSVLFIDDDPVFCRVAEKLGEQMGIAVTSCSSLEEVQAMLLPGIFDAAVVDFHLDGVAHDLKGTRIAGALGGTPVLLVSQDQHGEGGTGAWPSSVRGFIEKGRGPKAIFEAVLALQKRNERSVES